LFKQIQHNGVRFSDTLLEYSLRFRLRER